MLVQSEAIAYFLALQILLVVEDEREFASYCSFYEDVIVHKLRESEQRSNDCKKRRKHTLKKWSEWAPTSLNDATFRRYFRMPRECFDMLCKDIERNIGPEKFKSEIFIEGLENGTHGSDAQRRMHNAKKADGNGFLSGEIKLAIALRMLAGGSYLDLALIFDIATTSPYEIFHDVLENWICKDYITDFSARTYLSDVHRMRAVSARFAEQSRDIFTGCIGALDGWLVKIKKPTDKDNVSDPGDFFCRKGFYSINVQVIVDRDKRIIYRSIKSRGGEHDAPAFRESAFYKEMLTRQNFLEENGFYIITDSAYALRSTVLCPYTHAAHEDDRDNYNYFHSSSRIVVECAFGEIDMRWGILWKPLSFSLKNNVRVIDACLRLHNYIVNFRIDNSTNDDGINPTREMEIFENDLDYSRAADPGNGDVDGVHHPSNQLDRRYLTNNDRSSYEDGKRLRDEINAKIKERKLMRPRVNWYQKKNRVFHF